MKTMLAVLLALACATPTLAGLITPEAVTPTADLVVALSVSEGAVERMISSYSMFPDATGPVAKEHLEGFAKEWGIDLNAPLHLVFAMSRTHNDGQLSGRAKIDRAVFAKALKTVDPKVKVTESGDTTTITEAQAELVIKADGTFVIEKKGTGPTHAAGNPTLAGEISGRAGENATFAIWAKLPQGIPGPVPPAIAGQPIAGLWPRVRGVFAALREKDIAVDLSFDDPESAKAGQPMIAGYLKTLEGAIGAQAAAAESAARAKSPVNWMDPAWLGARLSLANVKKLTQLLQVTADGPRLSLSLSRDGLPGSNPLVTTAVVGVLAAIAVPNFKAARERANVRACYANQKTIVGAVEMYNLDKNTKRTTLDAGFFEELKSGGYLQTIPTDPGQGPNTTSHYQLVETGNGITCSFHGPIQR